MKEIEVHSRMYPDMVALVDDEDYDFLNQFRWTLRRMERGKKTYMYAVRYIRKVYSTWVHRTAIQMHRLILDAPQKMLVDHIDHNGLNNQKYNLRLATASQNGWHQKAWGNTSRFKGVSWSTPKGQWQAKIRVNGSRYSLGWYDSEIEAAIAYNIIAKQFHGEFAVLNEI